jgi:hypothetical protein
LILCIVTIGTIMVFTVLRWLPVSFGARGQQEMKYQNLETKNPVLNFSFEYPETGWFPVESTGRMEKYDMVYLRGPSNEKNGFTTIIDVTVRPLESGQTPRSLLGKYQKIDSNQNKFNILHEKNITVGGERAVFGFCEYETPPIYRAMEPAVLLKKRMVFLIRNDQSYGITMLTLASEDEKYTSTFERVLKTFQFKNDAQSSKLA